MQIPTGELAAAAAISGDSISSIHGSVRFFPCPEGVMVLADIFGLPEANPTGIFALHIHSGGDCSGTNFADSGMHYDPANMPHPRHAGDLPPLLSCHGHALMGVLTCRFTIDEIIGRTVIIHSQPDDFTSQPAGNAGEKIACGVIRPMPMNQC
ncbi:MAG: superoxide dismutase family protein [Firmicutes bacterium]|nr:superoxide dismutase family protein [Bacillota bacterium]